MIPTPRPIARAATIRAMDAALIEDVGLPGVALMELAGARCADAILGRHGRCRYVVLCGPGNNGGDGYVIARLLAAAGAPVVAVPVYPARSPDARAFARVAERLGLVRGLADAGLDRAEVVIDAVFGTGQRAPLALPPLPAITAPVVAVDVPTGVDADTGERVGDFPAPAWVVTIGRLKPFLFRAPVDWVLADIGLELVAPGEPPEAVLVEAVAAPPVPRGASKWDRGHVGIVAGSAEKAGAGVLAALGALGGGAGLVTLYVPREGWGRLGALPPEVMVEEPRVVDGRLDPAALARCDALVVGPGLGRAIDGPLRHLWAEDPRPVVFDADALRALDGAPAAHPRLLTPHAGEAAHLLGRPWRALEADRLATAAALRALAPSIYKGPCPIVTGRPLRVLAGGAPALGTGGSGDVLAGLCGALLAASGGARDRDEVERRALLGAWLHQRAGAGLPVGARASAIAEALPRARAEAEGG